MNNIAIIFMQFIIYSFLGYLAEVCYCSYKEKRFVNRGFMFGPLCPIYGVGSVLIIYSLTNFRDNPVIVFVLGMFITSIIEYYTSYLFEKIFHNKWWDYSNKPDNINGRICLSHSIYFGIGTIAIIYLTNPLIDKLLAIIPTNALFVIALIIFVIFTMDLIFSVIIAYNLKSRLIVAEELKNFKIKMIPKIFENKYYEQISRIKFKSNRLIKNYPNLAKNLRKELNTVRQMVLDTKNVKVKKSKRKKV